MAKRAGTPAPASDRDVDNHDNAPVPLTDQERADLLLVHMRQHRQVDEAMDAAMEAVRGIRKQRNRLRGLIKGDGFLLRYVDEAMADQDRMRSDADADAQNRTFIRKVARQPITGDDQDQLDLFSVVTSKGDASLDGDDATWAGRGLTVALRGGDPDPSEHGVPPEHLQAWQQGVSMGYETFDVAKKNVEAIEARRQPAD